MRVDIEFVKYDSNRSYYNKFYVVSFSVLDNNQHIQNVFMNCYDIYENNIDYIEMHNIINTDYLIKNNIEYIVENDEITRKEKVIPIGIVDFNNRNYTSNRFDIYNEDGKELYKANEIIDSIVRAIEIKYEKIKFLNRFDNNIGNHRVESINLDECNCTDERK